MLTMVRHRLTRPLRNSSRGMLPSEYSNSNWKYFANFSSPQSSPSQPYHLRCCLLLRVGVGQGTDQRHREQQAGVDCGREEGGGDGDADTSSLVTSEDCEGHTDPAGDGNKDSDHQAAPPSPAQHLGGRPVGRGDGQQVPGPSGQVRSGQVSEETSLNC